MHLVRLSNGRTSVELGSEPWAPLWRRLNQLGSVCESHIGDVTIVAVNGERFVKTSGWEGDALIATTPAGDRLLRSLVKTPAAAKLRSKLLELAHHRQYPSTGADGRKDVRSKTFAQPEHTTQVDD